jgi:hypothetical protein
MTRNFTTRRTGCPSCDNIGRRDAHRQMTRLATMKSGTGQPLRNIAIELAGHLPPVRAALAKTLAELDS